MIRAVIKNMEQHLINGLFERFLFRVTVKEYMLQRILTRVHDPFFP